MSAGESHGDDAWKLLEEKDKDLEIAARIGQSLLELNRELKTKNDFLEESLNASNDTIVQLRHELQLRTNLLHAYVENEDEVDASSKESVDGLQWKVKKLESENESLRAQALQLKKLSTGLEETERLHLTECSKNLDLANEKVNKLKALLSEKSSECAAQCVEVERLLKIVAGQNTREKLLSSENSDLREQIDETMMMYEELSKDYVVLQEKYTEVLSMLHDADEELRSVHKMSRNRNGSVDSLYDSLASELETSDSGICSTLNSSREVSRTNEITKKYSCLQLELETACLLELHEEETEAEVISPEISANPECEVKTELEKDGGGNCFCTSKEQSSLLCCSSDTQPSTSGLNNFAGRSDFEEQESLVLCEKTEKIVAEALVCSRTDDLLKSSSNDSLASYEGPKLGEPGKPGTRDLDFSLRKRGIRKEIEQEYAQFRLQKGLSPSSSSFFSMPSIKSYILERSERTAATGLKNHRMELSSKWKASASKGLVQPLETVSGSTVVSRASIQTPRFADMKIAPLTRNQSQSSVLGRPSVQQPSEIVKALGICNISRPCLPLCDRFDGNYLRRSDSLSLVGPLSSYDFSLKQFQSGIITRMRPST